MAESPSPQRFIFKFIILGDYAVGKTCVIRRYVSDTFDEEYKASIGVDITSQQLFFDPLHVQLQIWDMSGQTDFRELRRQFMNGSDCGIIVFDVTRRSSLENITRWINEAQANVPGLQFALVGNKTDLVDERVVKHEEAERAAKENQMLLYIETSAKSGSNIQLLFKKLAQLILERMK
ncbi:MAG: Rab family GTPase [Promethearchaeota archaeon]